MKPIAAIIIALLTRDEVIAKYERHLHDGGLIHNVHELRDGDLACCEPGTRTSARRCHCRRWRLVDE
jgi:hypothetical protein